MTPLDSTMRRPLGECLGQIARGRSLKRKLRMEPGAGDRDALEMALRDAVALFDALHIRYALIGGIAAMVYGRARFTEDVDFVAEPGHERLLADHAEIMRAHRFDPGCTWKLYHGSGIDVDIWKDEFAEQIVSRARLTMLDDVTIRVADPNDLVAMKLRAGRVRDDYDISELIRSGAAADEEVKQRVTDEQFQRYLALKSRSNT